jgi:ribosome-associated toxin RatA of RatAB toxin-antitoxin module
VPDQASSTIVIDAPADKVMAVIADFAAYPTWSPQIKRVDVLATDDQGRGTSAHFVIDAGVLRDEYTLDYDWSVPDAVSWHLVSGTMQKQQEGSYTLRRTGDGGDGTGGTEVLYELTVELAIPMLGLFKRRAEKMIIDTALKGLKRHIEGR